MGHLDPYAEIGHHVKRIANGRKYPTMEVGEVISESPLRVRIDRPDQDPLILENDDMLVNDNLCPNVIRDAEYQWKDENPFETGRGIWDFEYKEYLHVGDKVAMLACANTQLYILLARVKRYGS